jgi:N-acetylmuramoyl-L-alanine amidase
LRVTGVCDEDCWKALVEANWKLGDRMLLLTSPNMRGDDVAELQGSLARLGFDCGRVDGILGPLTARAVEEFQSNCGLPPDGVCGAATLRTVRRVISQTGDGPGIATVREQERLRLAPTSLSSLRVSLGQFGGLSSITRAVGRELRLAGAHVMALDELDAVAQARAANNFGADLYLGFEAGLAAETVIHYYKVPTFESVGGRTLAMCITAESRRRGLTVADPVGMRVAVLRETKMPAVLATIAPVRAAVDSAAELSVGLRVALEAWIRQCSAPEPSQH